jgi:hypothetical protein
MKILACPHCFRFFRVTPAALGKRIRCRGCKETFHVPRDARRAPLGPPIEIDDAGAQKSTDVLPVAIECALDGHDSRRCPKCERAFRMKPALAGKAIRCRGCRTTFRVMATGHAMPNKAGALGSTQMSPATEQLPPLFQSRRRFGQPPGPPIVPLDPSEDLGDILDEIVAAEHALSAVRPRSLARLTQANSNVVTQIVTVALGGACALPLTQVILWWVFGRDPLNIAVKLPDTLRWIVPTSVIP